MLYFAEPLLFLMLSYQSVSLICLIYQREAQIQLLGSFQVFALDRQITQNCFAVDFSYISPTTLVNLIHFLRWNSDPTVNWKFVDDEIHPPLYFNCTQVI